MLLNFRIANFRSLKEPQEFDLRAVYGGQQEPALNVAAVYGANASGKSNLLRGLRFMHDAVLDHSDWKTRGRIRVEPFLLDDTSKDEPSSFSVDLLVQGVRYVYGFSVTQERVVEEWLHSFPKKKKRILFEREGDEYYFGPSFASARANLLKEITDSKSLYLSSAAKAKQSEAAAVFAWFSESLWFVSDEDESRQLQRHITREVLLDAAMAPRIQSLLKAADLGIEETRAEDVSTFHFEEDTENLVEDGSLTIRRDRSGRTAILYRGTPPELTAGLRNLLESEILVQFKHLGETPMDFTLSQESRGTKTWFDISGVVVRALENGWTLVVDELDTSLHPLLLAQMIRLFQNAESNGTGAQLIFTTHDASLMGRHGGEELLRRDEIWFTQKDASTGSTELYPLTDFKPRAGLNWEKRYLGGAVGAVPYINQRDFENVASGGRDTA
ncbi:AAA family ATPase [Streptomyces specialis]|uniref:AAA family ATPase n=1 Tax=Streptomyces specialis TaxID=498367 RepID=UPI000ADEF40D|nr:ATP-binding protein [Streptomyces specialis]